MNLSEMWHKVAEAEQREIELNRHLGYPDDYQRGSLSVSIKWSDLKALLDEVEAARSAGRAMRSDITGKGDGVMSPPAAFSG